MSVGVIPLVALSGEAAAVQQADSMTREMTAMLARAATILRVVPVPPARAAAARDDARDAALALNVRYLVGRRNSAWARIATRIASAADRLRQRRAGLERVDCARTSRQPRPSGGEVFMQLPGILSRALISTEFRRVMAQPPEATLPLDYVLRALALERTEADPLRNVARAGKAIGRSVAPRPKSSFPRLVILARYPDSTGRL